MTLSSMIRPLRSGSLRIKYLEQRARRDYSHSFEISGDSTIAEGEFADMEHDRIVDCLGVENMLLASAKTFLRTCSQTGRPQLGW